jgi:hypothetical protein
VIDGASGEDEIFTSADVILWRRLRKRPQHALLVQGGNAEVLVDMVHHHSDCLVRAGIIDTAKVISCRRI